MKKNSEARIKPGASCWRALLLFGAAAYLIILCILVFFKDHTRALNLIPFRFVYDYIVQKQPMGISNIVGNILMFVPLGVYIPLFCKRGKPVLWVLLSSLGIEVIQYLFQRGVSDVDDIILNGIGGLIGIAGYHILHKRLGEGAYKLIAVLALCVLVLFTAIFLCLYYGVFGFKIRVI